MRNKEYKQGVPSLELLEANGTQGIIFDARDDTPLPTPTGLT